VVRHSSSITRVFQDITNPAGRQIKCLNPRVVQWYNKHLQQTIKQEGILEQLQNLYQLGIKQVTDTQIQDFNKINQLMIKAVEKKCRKFHVGKVPWTPVVMQAIYQILYWKGLKKWKTGGTICNMVLQHWVKTGLETYLDAHQQFELSKIQWKVKGAVQEYLQIKKQAD